jgi:predicted nucleotide-binding protein
MKRLYRRLLMIVQWLQCKLDDLAFALYLRAIDDELSEYTEDDTAELAPRDNSVHLPRRELH